MQKLREKLYDEPCTLTSQELSIIKFGDDFNRIYDVIYDNDEIETIVDNGDFLELGEEIIENKNNSEFFKKVYEEHGIVITSDRELQTLGILWNNYDYGLEK